MNYKTGKKYDVIAFLRESGGLSYTIEEICDKVLGGEGGKSTVYRLVSELVAEGTVRRLSDGRTRHCTYQYIGDDGCKSHLHLKCKECGRLIHLDERTTASVEEGLLAARGFSIDIGEVLLGRCRECAAD